MNNSINPSNITAIPPTTGKWYNYVSSPDDMEQTLNAHYIEVDSLRIVYIEDERLNVTFKGNRKEVETTEDGGAGNKPKQASTK